MRIVLLRWKFGEVVAHFGRVVSFSIAARPTRRSTNAEWPYRPRRRLQQYSVREEALSVETGGGLTIANGPVTALGKQKSPCSGRGLQVTGP
jgi:hypothetical protein